MKTSNLLTGRLVLNEGVLLVPVTDLPEESRSKIDCKDTDFAVSRLNARNGSKVVDADAASLLTSFQQERSVVEAVILFAKGRRTDPEKVLDTAYPFLRDMVAGGFLVPSQDGIPKGNDAEAGEQELGIGTVVPGGIVARTLQILEDTEVHQIAKADGTFSVFKIERRMAAGAQMSIRHRLESEALLLRHAGGAPAPRLLAQGEFRERMFLEIEFIKGVDVSSAAAECRERDELEGGQAVLALVHNLANAYADLHRRGIIHGDVHPTNALVTASGAIRLIDFGVSGAISDAGDLPRARERGGIPFFFEPELARAALAGSTIAASPAGEQHAVAALIYFIVTGTYWQNFRLGREDMLNDIATLPPLPFVDRGTKAWPELETILQRPLSKDPAQRFPSMEAFAEALHALRDHPGPARGKGAAPLAHLVDSAIANASPDGPWGKSDLSPAPTTSINYGSAGIAVGLLHMALSRDDADLLTWSDTWCRRAMREIGSEEAFYNEKIEITPNVVGRSSPYHSPSGVYAAAALIANASANVMGHAEALAGFLKAAEAPVAGLDLTLGKSSLLLGAALLLDATAQREPISVEPLKALGNRLMAELWQELDAIGEMRTSDIQYLGIAHGWAGFLYATMVWCDVVQLPAPRSVERRLHELAAFAVPVNRGLDWPWTRNQPGETMPGWCNGACGYVFLWTLAHRLFADAKFLELAEGAAWRSWETRADIVTLCCGLAGRAYALLNLYRHTKEEGWLERARTLALRGARNSDWSSEYSHSLYKGAFGLAVLTADLEKPVEARMPFFEPLGYSAK